MAIPFAEKSRNFDIMTVLAMFGRDGATVAELSLLLNRTGGDITRGITDIIRAQNKIEKHTEYHPVTMRRTVRYILTDIK